MPFIHIKSLPFEEPVDVPGIIKNIAADFSDRTGIQLNHIHTTWEFYQPGYYAKGNKAAGHQPGKNYPLIVDLLTPDFNDSATIALMLETIADSIARRAKFPKNNIFINHRQAHSGMVFDDGEIVHW
ncbi:MAG: hypothetical protein LJE83_12655 [Gammaproteobacteria bacterium]|jgi:hypothetical protein|nr:hypothetical protein [Gammaproteobacteria bacterium]